MLYLYFKVSSLATIFPSLQRRPSGGTTMNQRRTMRATGTIRPQQVTVRDFNSRLERQRAADSHVQYLKGQDARDKRLLANQTSDSRVEYKRRMQRAQQQNQELQTGHMLEHQAFEEEQKQVLQEQDAKLARAMADMKSQRLAEEANVRRIVEESDEIKQLRGKLKAAHMNKVRATQLAERDMLTKAREDWEGQMDAMMEDDRAIAVKKEEEEMQKRLFLQIQSKKVIQNQIQERNQRKAEAYEAFLKEKAMVDAVVAGIEAEDRAKADAQREKTKQLQDNITAYLEERRRWREEERRRAEEELRKIQEYNALQQQRHAEMMKNKKAHDDANDLILAKLTKEISERQAEEEEMRQLLEELYQEEAEQRALDAIKARNQKEAAMREEMLKANEIQKQLKMERHAQMQRDEAAFREQMMEKFANDRRLEQMNAARRYREMLDYKREVEEMIQERRKIYEAEVAAELEERRKKIEEEAYRKDVVERERIRLLEEHAKELRDYLPKGVFQKRSDFNRVMESNPRPDEVSYGLGGTVGKVKRGLPPSYPSVRVPFAATRNPRLDSSLSNTHIENISRNSTSRRPF